LTVAAAGSTETKIPIDLTVGSDKIPNSGDNDPWRLSRLRWLDSQLAADDEVIPPYTPVEVRGNQVSILGRRVTLAANGIPSSIESFFDIEMTHLAESPRELLAAPIALLAEDANGQVLPWTSDGVLFNKRAPGAVAWESASHAGPVKMDLHAQMEFDGNIEFNVTLDSTAVVKLNDFRLEIPLAADVARYVMGLGLKGGARPANFEWKWNVKRNQDSAWIGDVNAGLQFTLKDDHYIRPLNTNFYQSQPLVMPASGTIMVREAVGLPSRAARLISSPVTAAHARWFRGKRSITTSACSSRRFIPSTRRRSGARATSTLSSHSMRLLQQARTPSIFIMQPLSIPSSITHFSAPMR